MTYKKTLGLLGASLCLSGQDAVKLEKIKQKRGYVSISEAIRVCIRNEFDRCCI